VEPLEQGNAGEATDADGPVFEQASITKFLTLPTIIACINSKRQDPIINFAKSLIFTSDQYISTVQDMRNSKEDSAKLREQQRVEREESRKKKAVEKEAASARRVAEQEEAQPLKNERLAQRAEALVVKVAAREEAACAKATRAAEVAAARLAKAVE
jgi:hypothetical protein